MNAILNFFSTKKVQAKIMQGTLSETECFLYLYFILMFDAIGLTVQALAVANKQPTALDLVNIWGYLLITGIGLIILFIANGGSKGKDLVKKFFSFSFTVGYKYVIALIVLDSLSVLIPAHLSQSYRITIYLLMNVIMVFNIAYRIHQTKQS